MRIIVKWKKIGSQGGIYPIATDANDQVLFVGDPNNKSKMADGSHFEKPINRRISATVWWIVTKSDAVTRADRLNPTDC